LAVHVLPGRGGQERAAKTRAAPRPGQLPLIRGPDNTSTMLSTLMICDTVPTLSPAQRNVPALTRMSVFHRISSPTTLAGQPPPRSSSPLRLRGSGRQLTILTVVPDVPSPSPACRRPYDLKSVYVELQENARGDGPGRCLRYGDPAQRNPGALHHDRRGGPRFSSYGHPRSRAASAKHWAGSVSRAVVHSLRGAVC